MPDYRWPDAKQRTVIGTRVSRVDGSVKASGHAKYTYDQNPQGLLHAALVRCPYPHAKIVSIDTSAAESMPGVKVVHVIQEAGKTVQWSGDEVVAIAAVDERTAEDAVRAVKIEYQPLPHNVVDEKEPPKDIASAEGPLSQDDLRDMFVNQVPTPQIIKAVQDNGISFQITPDFVDQMKKNQVPQSLIDALQAAPVKPAVDRPPTFYKKAAAQTQGDPDAAFQQAEVTSEGDYGLPVIAHCCLESHGSVAMWPSSDKLDFQVSTQNVSGIASQMAEGVGLPASSIRVHQEHIGGGFGSKFGPDRWGIVCALLSKKAGGAPVKLMLDRASELEIAGARPSAFAHVKVGAKKDGTLVAWDSQSWGTGGPGGGGMPPIPYIFKVPNSRTQHTAVVANIGPARAWRAPNHPQAAVLTMCPLDDLAAKLGMDPIEFFKKNLTEDMAGPRYKNYIEEFEIADKLMNWKARWHARGDKTPGPVKRGLGASLHTWGGRGHASDCDFTIHPDGTVEIKMGTQDLGTGTRTCIMMVAADALGLKPQQIDLKYGDTNYPPSGGSGGSTTIGGVSSSTHRAAVDARDALFGKVAPALGTTPDKLEAVNGTVRVIGTPSKAMPWKQACARLGATGVTTHGKNPDRTRPPDLTNAGVAGVQLADVSVDTETGIVRVNKMVAVQDCGLVINVKTAESQVFGAMIMGISYSLFEEKIFDPTTGRMLNPNMEFYRLAGYGDIPELVVHMMTGPGYDERGVIGLGEPPTVSPGAALSNAVANAIGVRVPHLPLTPDRVLAALANSGSMQRGGE